MWENLFQLIFPHETELYTRRYNPSPVPYLHQIINSIYYLSTVTQPVRASSVRNWPDSRNIFSNLICLKTIYFAGLYLPKPKKKPFWRMLEEMRWGKKYAHTQIYLGSGTTAQPTHIDSTHKIKEKKTSKFTYKRNLNKTRHLRRRIKRTHQPERKKIMFLFKSLQKNFYTRFIF